MTPEAIVKIVSIITLGVIFAITAIFMPNNPQIWGSVLGLLSLVLGGGSAIKGVTKYVFRIDRVG